MSDFERAQRNRTLPIEAWCVGCGLYWLVFNRHRYDCTARPLNDSQGAIT
jgi:hypothetical protein